MWSLSKALVLQNHRQTVFPGSLAGFYLSGWIILICVITNNRMLHWFLIPTWICGVLISQDAILWLKGEYDLFDPKGLLGALGWHLFFLAPMLFIYWDVGMRYVVNPSDWRPWVGVLSLMNICSLIFYRWFHALGYHAIVPKKLIFRVHNHHKILSWFLCFLVLAFLSQGFYFSLTGGITGILNLLSIKKQTGGLSIASNVGTFRIIGNSIPIILIIFLTLYKEARKRRGSSFIFTIVIMLGLGLVQFLFGGIQGSRSATVWSMFWMAGIVHYFWRPFSRRFVMATLAGFIFFMYLYGFYKGNSVIHGSEAVAMLIDGTALNELEKATGRTFKEMVVADIARVDTQSFELYRLAGNQDYRLRWGETYLSAFLSFVPGWIWPGRPLEPAKVAAGTDLFYGQGSYIPGDKFWNSQKVYGLGGEALLNFGFLAFPLPFGLWGFLIGLYRRSMLTWRSRDFRWYLAPFVSLLFIIALIGDFYNLLGFFISKGVIPIMLLWLAFRLTGQKTAIEEGHASQG